MTDQKNIKVEGNQNIVGDYNNLIFNEYHMKRKLTFSQSDLQGYQPPHYQSPNFIDSLVNQLDKNKIILLGGHHMINTDALARHLAWYMSQSHLANTHDWIPQEWIPDLDKQNLDIAINEVTEPSILILTKLMPQNVNYDLSHLREIAQSKNHLIIASTNLAQEAWKLPPHEKEVFWREITPNDYNTTHLSIVLKQKLNSDKAKLPENIKQQDWDNQTYLLESLSFEYLVKTLGTPENIHKFVDLLCIEETINIKGIQKIISQLKDYEATLRQWYYQLEARHKLLTVALTFFDGLFDDQFFASLDFLVQEPWRTRNPLLPHFDYYDLDSVQSIFNLVQARDGRVKVENRSPDQRQTILKMAWQSHRRYIVTTLPYLVILAKQSVRNKSDHIELYGTNTKKEQMRAVVSQTFSDIGLISYESVETPLLEMVADGHPQIQAIVATAMAQWRLYNQDELLFNTINHWQTNPTIRSIITSYLNEQEQLTASSCIQATIAIIVAFASTFDPPNQLSDKLHDLFKDLSTSSNGMVRHRFTSYTLPILVGQHWKQLTPTLRSMTRQAHLIPSIALSLAYAYRFQPEEILALLQQWQSYCNQFQPQRHGKRPRQREGMLATVALTYGYMSYDKNVGKLSAEEGFSKLEAILQNNNEHSFVRIAVLRAISLKANERFDEVEVALRSLVETLQEEEQQQIIDIITSVYLKQRQLLQGGDYIIHVNEEPYEVWLEGTRPLTEIETSMFNWIEQTTYKQAQKIALKSFASFSRMLDYELSELVIQYKQEKHQKSIQNILNDAHDENIYRQASQAVEKATRSTLIIWLTAKIVSLGKQSNITETINNLLPEVVEQNKSNTTNIDFVLNRWQRYPDSHFVSNTGGILKRALQLIRNGTAIGCLTLLFLVAFICFSLSLFS